MKIEKIKEILEGKNKGTFVSVGWQSDITSARAKKNGVTVIKQTDTLVRWGVQYDHLASVVKAKEERESSGEPVRQITPWYKHMEGATYLLQKLSDESKTYLQLFPVRRQRAKTKYFINGAEATKQQVIESGYVNASEFNKQTECLVMSIPTENIRYIGKK